MHFRLNLFEIGPVGQALQSLVSIYGEVGTGSNSLEEMSDIH